MSTEEGGGLVPRNGRDSSRRAADSPDFHLGGDIASIAIYKEGGFLSSPIPSVWEVRVKWGPRIIHLARLLRAKY